MYEQYADWVVKARRWGGCDQATALHLRSRVSERALCGGEGGAKLDSGAEAIQSALNSAKRGQYFGRAANAHVPNPEAAPAQFRVDPARHGDALSADGVHELVADASRITHYGQRIRISVRVSDVL